MNIYYFITLSDAFMALGPSFQFHLNLRKKKKKKRPDKENEKDTILGFNVNIEANSVG